ncbi:MAG: hypothetical protein KBS81_08795, partial [Spirochaetales bacterium]|nr:hypothetical protein [Candidatus Physcosoma equi]
MKVIVHGCTGRMGQVIIDLCNKGFAGGSFAAGISPDVVKEEGVYHQTYATSKEEADVVIDFSFHTATRALLDYCMERKLPVVVATTAHTPEEKAMIEEASKVIPVFYTFNMSLGIAVLADLAKRAAL